MTTQETPLQEGLKRQVGEFFRQLNALYMRYNSHVSAPWMRDRRSQTDAGQLYLIQRTLAFIHLLGGQEIEIQAHLEERIAHWNQLPPEKRTKELVERWMIVFLNNFAPGFCITEKEEKPYFRITGPAHITTAFQKIFPDAQ